MTITEMVVLDGMGFKAGDICYILESNRKVRQAKIAGRSGEFYTIQLIGSCGAIRLKESRLFTTEEDARKSMYGYTPKIDENEAKRKYEYVDVFEGRRTNRSPHM